MPGRGDGIDKSQIPSFRSLRTKLLTLMITLALLPLVGMAVFSYFIVSKQVTEDRIRLSLEMIAQDTADKVDMMLRDKKEESHSMATTFPLIYPALSDADAEGMTRLLNNYCFSYEVYDALVVVDHRGNIVATNTADRNGSSLAPQQIDGIVRHNIGEYAEEKALFEKAATGYSWHHDWYRSKLAARLYAYDNEDISHSYHIAFAEPIRNPASHEVIGVWIAILNWFYIQTILDNVEMDLANLDMKTGYAFMFAQDGNSIIAHKYRLNRKIEAVPHSLEKAANLYGTRLIQDHGLGNLHQAVRQGLRNYAYEFPEGNSKMSGLAPIEDTSFGWIVGVGIDGNDIFRPITVMSWWLAAVTVFFAILVTFFTYLTARGITVPLRSLITGAQTIAQGNFEQRVQVRTSDEVGILGATFNDMARALSSREQQLQELNKNLESMVRQRTRELEDSHEALKKAYLELQNTQDQLIQTEKMASLGQLVAGIAHEIKNPLNFIYGNTGFLEDYTNKLQELLLAYDRLPSLSPADRAAMEKAKGEMNFAFIKEDLQTLIDNFTEGARRINNIVSDLRTFSRMDADRMSEIDVHASLEMSLNLLRNQYRDRVEIHREYDESSPHIRGYAGKLNQVFMNLLANAFQAVKQKGDVWIRTRRNDGMVEVEIEDNGVGIAKEHLNRIFEPFFTTKPVGQGTGLGLSISYGIVEQHGGKIHVSSAPQKGSCFTVRLPLHKEEASAR
jgi:signal transduction histidine kinase